MTDEANSKSRLKRIAAQKGKRCGTCRWFTLTTPPDFPNGNLEGIGRCLWPIPVAMRPFLGRVTTYRDDGINCPTWAAKEPTK